LRQRGTQPIRVPTINEQRLAAYIEAEAKILKGQSVRMGERYLQQADLEVVRDAIADLQRTVAAEQAAAAGRQRGVAQADFGGVW
jgi:hypothetical protein